MPDLISSTSYVRKRIEELRERKRLARDVEAALEQKKAKDAEEKKQKSDARIAAKMARLFGVEAPAAKALEPVEVKAEEPVEVQEEIAVEEEPVIKKTPKKAAPKKPIEQTEEE